MRDSRLVTSNSWVWFSLAALGVFHGLNPAMGWLFAVALGLQEQRARAIFGALVPIALGHAVAIGLFAFATALLGQFIPQTTLALLAGTVLLSFALWRIIRRARHPRTRFRARPHDLVLWSFLSASAHGAGLMVAPLLVALNLMPPTSDHLTHATSLPSSLSLALAAVFLHTLAMWVTMTIAALIVYVEVGVGILRSAWINVDRIWMAALFATGLLTVGSALIKFL